MDAQAKTRAYDLFKLIVAILLLILFIILMLQGQNLPLQAAQTPSSQVVESAPATLVALPLADPTQETIQEKRTEISNSTVISNGAVMFSTDVDFPGTTMPALGSSMEITPTLPSENPFETLPLVLGGELIYTEPDISQPSPTPVQMAAGADGICPLPLPSRASVGKTVRVLAPLYVRTKPEISDNVLIVMIPGNTAEIIGGPVCTPHQDRAYLWWQVRTTAGTVGWSAEGSLNAKPYFLEPLEK